MVGGNWLLESPDIKEFKLFKSWQSLSQDCTICVKIFYFINLNGKSEIVVRNLKKIKISCHISLLTSTWSKKMRSGLHKGETNRIKQ